MTAPDGPHSGSTDEYLVQLRVRGVTYASLPLPLADAEQLLKDTRRDLLNIGDSYGLIEFAAAGYPQLWIRARQVSALQLVPRHRGRAATSSAGHLATGGPVPTVHLVDMGRSVMPTAPVVHRSDITGRVIG